MTTFDSLWQILTAFDSLWQLLKAYDNFWKLLTAFEIFWQFFTAYESLWQPLTAVDSFCQLLTAYDSLWQLLKAYNIFWQLMTIYAILWQLLTAYDNSSQLLTAYDSFWHGMDRQILVHCILSSSQDLAVGLVSIQFIQNIVFSCLRAAETLFSIASLSLWGFLVLVCDRVALLGRECQVSSSSLSSSMTICHLSLKNLESSLIKTFNKSTKLYAFVLLKTLSFNILKELSM